MTARFKDGVCIFDDSESSLDKWLRENNITLKMKLVKVMVNDEIYEFSNGSTRVSINKKQDYLRADDLNDVLKAMKEANDLQRS